MKLRSIHRPQRGFTLIELMITVAVVAILAAIAYPAYTEQVRKSRRSAAASTLMEVASKQQQLFLDRRSYQAAANVAALEAAPLRVNVPSSARSFYAFSVTTGTAADGSPTFTITAAPSGNQMNDKCGTMTLDQAGAKTAAASCPAGGW